MIRSLDCAHAFSLFHYYYYLQCSPIYFVLPRAVCVEETHSLFCWNSFVAAVLFFLFAWSHTHTHKMGNSSAKKLQDTIFDLTFTAKTFNRHYLKSQKEERKHKLAVSE